LRISGCGKPIVAVITRMAQNVFPVSQRRWLWPLAVAGLIFFASTRSQVAAPGIPHIDKVGHFGIYGLLATLICRLGRDWRAAVWALLLVSAYGVTDEWHQSFVPGRSCEVGDWVARYAGRCGGSHPLSQLASVSPDAGVVGAAQSPG